MEQVPVTHALASLLRALVGQIARATGPINEREAYVLRERLAEVVTAHLRRASTDIASGCREEA